MRVLVADIKAKIPDLPANVRDLVTIDPDDRSLAYVRSRSSDATYTVHIEPHVDDPGDKSIINSVCGCPAHKLCWHVTAFYAVAKDLLPVAGFVPKTAAEKPSDTPQPPEPVDEVQVTVERNTDELRRLISMLIQTSAAVVAEAERLLKEER